jgi:hypothetical protein
MLNELQTCILSCTGGLKKVRPLEAEVNYTKQFYCSQEIHEIA